MNPLSALAILAQAEDELLAEELMLEIQGKRIPKRIEDGLRLVGNAISHLGGTLAL